MEKPLSVGPKEVQWSIDRMMKSVSSGVVSGSISYVSILQQGDMERVDGEEMAPVPVHAGQLQRGAYHQSVAVRRVRDQMINHMMPERTFRLLGSQNLHNLVHGLHAPSEEREIVNNILALPVLRTLRHRQVKRPVAVNGQSDHNRAMIPTSRSNCCSYATSVPVTFAASSCSSCSGSASTAVDMSMRDSPAGSPVAPNTRHSPYKSFCRSQSPIRLYMPLHSISHSQIMAPQSS